MPIKMAICLQFRCAPRVEAEERYPGGKDEAPSQHQFLGQLRRICTRHLRPPPRTFWPDFPRSSVDLPLVGMGWLLHEHILRVRDPAWTSLHEASSGKTGIVRDRHSWTEEARRDVGERWAPQPW